MTIDKDELKLLAAMAFGEASAKHNDFKEMAGIASVLLRQRDARGYASMQAFTTKEPTYSYAVSDGNARYAVIMKTTEEDAVKKLSATQAALMVSQNDIKLTNESISTEIDSKKKKAAQVALEKLKKTERTETANVKDAASQATAFSAARHAFEGGEDYSNGGYFWDGADIKTNYKKHFKVRHGIKITNSEHNIYNIEDSIKLVIIKKIMLRKNSEGKMSKTEVEIGRYDHIYESTAAHGGTIFWKQNQTYLDLTGAKAYK